jgi:methyl-accepting chemotaxis protein
VVADEVRKLAERTRQSTREIEATIHSMREGIEKVATSIHAGSERVDAGVRVIAGLSAELQAIQDDIGRSSGLVGEIVDATRAQNDASQGLAREVEAIARTAEANHQAVERTAGMARGLMGVAADLRGAVAGLRV